MTSTDIATTDHTGSALVLQADQDRWSEQQLAALKQMGLEKAGQGDLAVFLHVSQRTGLDPFGRQIYMIGRNAKENNQWVTKYTIQTGIDGFRLIARRASDRLNESLEYEDTQWCGADGVWTDVWTKATAPAAARVTVLRHGKRFPGIALYREYVQTTRDGNPNSMWSKMPGNQLAKCAEALALRKAFPQDLSGIYTDDEMGPADRPERAEPPSGLAAALRRDTVAGEVVAEPPADPEALNQITSSQLKKMGALMRELGITDRAQALMFVADVIGREIQSRNDLLKGEASKVIDALTSDLEKPFGDTPNPPPDEGGVHEGELVDEPDTELPIDEKGGKA